LGLTHHLLFELRVVKAGDIQLIHDLDDLLADYFHELYEVNEGRGKQKAHDTLNGIQMLMPRAKGKLLVAARVANRWSKLKKKM
jgi:hypothetical protein